MPAHIPALQRLAACGLVVAIFALIAAIAPRL